MVKDTPAHLGPDWRDASSYDYTRDFTHDAWAWEFLRRNPTYRAGAAMSGERISGVLRRVPLIVLLEGTDIAKGAYAWGLHFFRSAKPPSGFCFRLLVGRRESRSAYGRSLSRLR